MLGRRLAQRGGVVEVRRRGVECCRPVVRAMLGDKRKATTGGFQSAQGYDGAGGAGCQRLDGDRPAELLCQVAMTFCPSA